MKFINLLYSGKTYRNIILAAIILVVLTSGSIQNVSSDNPTTLWAFACISYAAIALFASLINLLYNGISDHFSRKEALEKWESRMKRKDENRGFIA
ncbi:hypothetical protein [Paenibacillus luteus]|uniref:hypothetical protein n=1 Tax=Paenibacillus luteus TaxID=2545753 RepID=UPI00114186F8|nr:hypothetical protein [Paenibacillus luteus]